MKKYFTIISVLLLFQANLSAGSPNEDKARGVFFAFGVGPRLPVGFFANSSDLGYGFNFEFSYTDNDYLPVFLFARAGFETYPGSQSFYQQSDYSNYSTNVLPVNAGIRYYFTPLIESVVLLIPMVEASFNYSYYQKLNQFKPSSLRSNYTEKSSKIGLSVGGGFSMFLMEVLATYNYFQSNQYIAVDLKVRLPLYITF
jgi:hypothetical protein